MQGEGIQCRLTSNANVESVQAIRKQTAHQRNKAENCKMILRPILLNGVDV